MSVLDPEFRVVVPRERLVALHLARRAAGLSLMDDYELVQFLLMDGETHMLNVCRVLADVPLDAPLPCQPSGTPGQPA